MTDSSSIHIKSIPYVGSQKSVKNLLSVAQMDVESGTEPINPWNANCTQRLLWNFSEHYLHSEDGEECSSHSSLEDVISDFVSLLSRLYVDKLVNYLKNELHKDDINEEEIITNIFGDRRIGAKENLDLFETSHEDFINSQIVLFKQHADASCKNLLPNSQYLSNENNQQYQLSDHCDYTLKVNPRKQSSCLFNQNFTNAEKENANSVISQDDGNLCRMLSNGIEIVNSELNKDESENSKFDIEKKTQKKKTSHIFKSLLPKYQSNISDKSQSKIIVQVKQTAEIEKDTTSAKYQSTVDFKQNAGSTSIISIDKTILKAVNQDKVKVTYNKNTRKLTVCPYCADDTTYTNELLLKHFFKVHTLTTISVSCPDEDCKKWFDINKYIPVYWEHIKAEHSMQVVSKNIIWKCEVCDFSFNLTSINLLQVAQVQILHHFVEKHLPTEKCSQCSIAFFDNDVLKLHEQIHKGLAQPNSSDSAFMCELCGFQCKDYCVYIDHLITFHPTSSEGKKYSIELTKSLLINVDNDDALCFAEYMDVEFSKNNETAKVSTDFVLVEKTCPFCGVSSKDIWDREKHFITSHRIQSVVIQCPSEEKCSEKFSITQLAELKDHLKKNHLLTPDLCQPIYCNLSCSECSGYQLKTRYTNSILKAYAANVLLHYEKMHFPKIRCQKCNLQFFKGKILKEHNTNHELEAGGKQINIMVEYFNGEELIGKSCTECTFYSDEPLVMYDHILTFHPCTLRFVERDDGHLRCQKKYTFIPQTEGRKKIVHNPGTSKLSELSEDEKETGPINPGMSELSKDDIRHINCLFCEVTVHTSSQLKKHFDEIHPKEQTRYCYLCHMYAKNNNKNEWLEHIDSEVHTSNVKTRYKYFPCVIPGCSIKFQTFENVCSHIVTNHKDIATDVKLKKKYTESVIMKCELCDEIIPFKYGEKSVIGGVNVSDFLRPYREHMKEYHGMGKLCEYCGELHTTRAGLRSHHKMCGIPDKDKQCPQCKRIFKHKKYLTYHMKVTHSTSKDYVCDVCNKAFAVKCLLTYHKKLHSGKTLECQYCGKGFPRRDFLRKHLKRCDQSPYAIYDTRKPKTQDSKKTSKAGAKNTQTQIAILQDPLTDC